MASMNNANLRNTLRQFPSAGNGLGRRVGLSVGSVALVLGMMVVQGGSIALAQDQAPPQAQASGQRTDGQIEMDVVHALDAVPQLKDDWITAGTVGGVVTLSGTSGSAENRTLAEQTAAKVPGVSQVVNSLKVGDPQTAQGAAGSSDQQQAEAAPSAQAEPPTGMGQAQADNAPQPPPAQPDPPQLQDRPNYQRQAPTPYARQGQYPQQPQYASEPEGPREPVTIAQGQLLKVRTAEALTSKRAKDGEVVEFTVVRDVYSAGVLAIPRGASIRGRVVNVKQAGTLSGSPELELKLTTLELEGKSYDLDSDSFSLKGPSKTGRTVSNALGGAMMGAIIGGAVGRGSGAAIGAAAGGAAGTAGSAATPGPQAWLPAEALLDFHLNSPLTVTPVSRAEAQRLASSMPAGGPPQRPMLYRRYRPYGYPPPPPPPGYYAPYPN